MTTPQLALESMYSALGPDPIGVLPESAMRTRTLESFGPRLAAIRQAKGLTQAELGEAVGVSQRVIAYYETETQQPPGALLADLARALKVSADELLGLKPVSEKTSPRTARLMKRLGRVAELPAADQRAVLKLIEALIEARARTTRASGTRKAS